MSIKLEHLNYVYSAGTAYEKQALKDVCLEIPHGEFVGIIGHTGSGKSTLIQHLNGLVKATSGALYYDGKNIYEPGYNMRELRNQVGLVFQYPEHQLFEVDVMSDVCFGPKNQGLNPDQCMECALEALKLVGLKEKYYNSSPFELSGGQKRRVAIAGVLAMEPRLLVLDEPAAGLDPEERIHFRNLFAQEAKDKLVLLSTHIIEDVQSVCDRLIVIHGGELLFDGRPEQLVARAQGHVGVFQGYPPQGISCEVTAQVNTAGGILCRAVAEKLPETVQKVEPTLEDAYVYLVGKEGKRP